jgi:hypothetical protein
VTGCSGLSLNGYTPVKVGEIVEKPVNPLKMKHISFI